MSKRQKIIRGFEKPDLPLFIFSLILISAGLLVLSLVSAVYSMEKFNDPNYSLFHQLFFGFLPGLSLGIFFFFLPLEKLKKAAFWFLLFNIFLLVLLIFPKFGFETFGAARWLVLGSITFQPSELLKLSFIVYLAAWFSQKGKSKNFRSWFNPLFPFLPILALIAALLALQPDVGTMSIIGVIGVALFFLAGTPWWQNLFIWISGLASLGVLIKIAPYRLSRLLVFLNPDFDPMGKGYQIKQALIAVGSGGLFGRGLGLSGQKFGFLPQAIGDAIFPVFAEEAGFFWSLVLIAIFLLFVWQGLKIASRSKDEFSQLLAAGISLWIGLQALINICSMIGLLPLTGVPLPFFSYGGSHLMVEMAAVGILLNISKKVS